MPTQTLEAIYEGGAFRPTSPLELPLSEGESVRLSVEAVPAVRSVDEKFDILEALGSLFDDIPEEERREIEKHWVRRPLFRSPAPLFEDDDDAEPAPDEARAAEAKAALRRLQSWFADLPESERQELVGHWTRRPLFGER